MLTITLLGTAATMPLPDRALTAAVAECGGHSLLFDCGEGTQTAARRAGVNLMKLDAICLTHYHGDHIFGLPGLLQTLGCQGRTRPLALYGPKGLGEVWAALRVLTGPLPYPVCPEVLDAPATLRERFGGWPQGAKLTPVPTRHRVTSQGYRLDLPRAGRFSPEKARALGVPVQQWKMLQQGQSSAGIGPRPGPAGPELPLFGGHGPLCRAGAGRRGGGPSALRRHLRPARAGRAGEAVRPQHLRAERSPCRKGRCKTALARPLFAHDHRPGGGTCAGPEPLPGGGVRLRRQDHCTSV